MGCYKHSVSHVAHSDELTPYDTTLAHIRRHTSMLILCNGLMTEKHITNYKTIKKSCCWQQMKWHQWPKTKCYATVGIMF